MYNLFSFQKILSALGNFFAVLRLHFPKIKTHLIEADCSKMLSFFFFRFLLRVRIKLTLWKLAGSWLLYLFTLSIILRFTGISLYLLRQPDSLLLSLFFLFEYRF